MRLSRMMASISMQPALIQIEQLVVRNALLLQAPDDVAIVGLRPVALLRQLGGGQRHLIARLYIVRERTLHDFLRTHVDTDVLEIVGIQLQRQLIGLACPRQHGGARPGVVRRRTVCAASSCHAATLSSRSLSTTARCRRDSEARCPGTAEPRRPTDRPAPHRRLALHSELEPAKVTGS